jgi:hypothetical protein
MKTSAVNTGYYSTWYGTFVSRGLKRIGEADFAVPYLIRHEREFIGMAWDPIMDRYITPIGNLTEQTFFSALYPTGRQWVVYPTDVAMSNVAQIKRAPFEYNDMIVEVYFYSFQPALGMTPNFTYTEETNNSVVAGVLYCPDRDADTKDPFTAVTRTTGLEDALLALFSAALDVSENDPASGKPKMIKNLYIVEYH